MRNRGPLPCTLRVTRTAPMPYTCTNGSRSPLFSDGNITAVDALFVLRFVAALPVNLPQGCRPVGT